MVSHPGSQAKPNLRVCLLQSEPTTGGIPAALEALEVGASQASQLGADLLVTPEMFLSGYNIGAQAIRTVAEPLSGPTLRAVAGIARRYGLALVVGLAEGEGDAENTAASQTAVTKTSVFNTAVFVGPDGQILASYRKTHLYGDVDVAQFSAGSTLCAPFDYLGWRLSLAICYDIEFPEVARAQALAWVDAIVTPTANMDPYTSVSERMVPTRAEENGLFIVYANYVGAEGDFNYCGGSCVVSPDGSDLARAGRQATMLTADLHHETLAQIREQSPYLANLRPDLYSGPT